MSAVHEILYCSVLAPDQPIGIVGRIVSQARARNAQHRITGLLVFDGLRFCQHVEGSHDDVVALMRRMRSQCGDDGGLRPVPRVGPVFLALTRHVVVFLRPADAGQWPPSTFLSP